VIAQGDGTGPSDHSSFYLKDMPVLHFFTDLHDDYHRATDDIEKINAEGEARVIELAQRIIRDLADRPSRLAFVRSATAPVGASSRDGSNTYLGSVPDMAAGDVPGMRLTGIRPSSPAEIGGLKAGDIIVEFDGRPVTDLYSYTDALYARQPGDKVRIVVLRGTERVTVNVVLGKRGG
jgi:S1-C subfamily serine protease